uniref:nitric-oxide synthase (NADPH) n=1 Tax=Anopheles epiroticus TaxID=199890 RepID=A0A182PCN1_9DIPT
MSLNLIFHIIQPACIAAQRHTVMSCSREVCMGSVMTPHVIGTETRKPEIVQQHAKDFLDQYYSSIRRTVRHVGLLFKSRLMSIKSRLEWIKSIQHGTPPYDYGMGELYRLISSSAATFNIRTTFNVTVTVAFVFVSLASVSPQNTGMAFERHF